MNQSRESKRQNAKLNYRVATGDDAALLQRLVEDGFRHPDTWTGDTSGIMAQFSISLDVMIEKITKPGSTFIIVTETTTAGEEEAAVVVACFQVIQKNPTVARFATFAIGPRHQGRGLGRQIVRYAEDYCRKTWGSTMMQLNTLSSRVALLEWYERCGYRETGVREPFPLASFGSGLGGEEGLYFAVMEKELTATSDETILV